MMDLEPEEYFRNPKISAHVLKEKKNVFPTKQKNNVETNPHEMANPQRCAVQKKCVLDFSGVWFSLQTGDMTTKWKHPDPIMGI